MNTILMRQIISAIDEHQISNKWIENLTLETTADIEQAVKDWNQLKADTAGQLDAKATADIEAWASSRSSV